MTVNRSSRDRISLFKTAFFKTSYSGFKGHIHFLIAFCLYECLSFFCPYFFFSFYLSFFLTVCPSFWLFFFICPSFCPFFLMSVSICLSFCIYPFITIFLFFDFSFNLYFCTVILSMEIIHCPHFYENLRNNKARKEWKKHLLKIILINALLSKLFNVSGWKFEKFCQIEIDIVGQFNRFLIELILLKVLLTTRAPQHDKYFKLSSFMHCLIE